MKGREKISVIPELGTRYAPYLFLPARPDRLLQYSLTTTGFPFKVVILKFIHSFTKCLLGAYNVPVFVLECWTFSREQDR